MVTSEFLDSLRKRFDLIQKDLPINPIVDELQDLFMDCFTKISNLEDDVALKQACIQGMHSMVDQMKDRIDDLLESPILDDE